jgi:two-component system response regulator LytT
MDQQIRVLIVDDEMYSRSELGHLLQAHPHIDIVGEAESGEEAVLKSIQLQPDVVFLDIEMPKMNGMEVASSLRELKKSPLLVFATAYPDFAAKAFRYEALDYLLKPFDEEQVLETVMRLKKLFLQEVKPDEQKRSGKLAVDTSGDIFYLDPKDIVYILYEERASKVMTTKGEYSTKTPLKELERRLSSYDFFRIHKSYLVNIHYIKRLTPWFNGAYQLEIEGFSEQLSVSRNYVKVLRARLEI